MTYINVVQADRIVLVASSAVCHHGLGQIERVAAIPRIAPLLFLSMALSTDLAANVADAAHPATGFDSLEPWASNQHPQDVARRHVQEITSAVESYSVWQGGTMDGTNCRSPIGGGFGIWEQHWESNRAVRLENVGETDLVNPWLSNGRNDFRNVSEIISTAVRPGMSRRETALALWRLQTTHRFHASALSPEMSDPVKVLNVYGYTTCGDDSICLAGLWRAAGFDVRPARVVGHCISQVYFDGRWNLLDADMGALYLLRDNQTIAGEQDLVRDHDLVKRVHSHGILDTDNRAADEIAASLFVAEGEWEASRDGVRDTTMSMVLRPNEAIVWRWGYLVPLKYHGHENIELWGPRSDAGRTWGAQAAQRICNGRWEYRPDFSRPLWRAGAQAVEGVEVRRGELVPEEGRVGRIEWKMASPYVFVGGALEVAAKGARFSVSFDGESWDEVGTSLDALFPANGPARYAYWLQCELPSGASLGRLGILNDVQMAPLALPGMVVGENYFTYTDESPGSRAARITHAWVERSLSRPPEVPAGPVFPEDGGRTDGTDIEFRWQGAEDADGDSIADYHFQLSDRPDMAWPLSSNFEKLMSNTAQGARAAYRAACTGALAPGTTYYWRVRAKDSSGVWGDWSQIWSFTPSGPAPPTDVRFESTGGRDGPVVLRWQANRAGAEPARYRVYGSDEKGFSVSDESYPVNVGRSEELPLLSALRNGNFPEFAESVVGYCP